MNHIVINIGEIPKISIKFGNITAESGDAPPYDGKYIVKPLPFEETKLKTRGKLMGNDVRILEIPYYEVSNENGNTVYIGGESEVIINA